MNILIASANGFVGSYLAKKSSNLPVLIVLLQQTICFSQVMMRIFAQPTRCEVSPMLLGCHHA